MQVLKRVGTQAYKLDLPPALRQHHPVFHVALLRRAFQAPAPAIPTGPSRTSQPAGTTSKADQLSEDEYEVDRIVAERKHKYRVRWTGYDASEDSWISKHDLQTSAPAVVAAWKA